MQRITYTQGNTFSVSVPMIKKMVEKVDNATTITTEDYIPEEGDIIEVRLIGERRQYRYTPTIEGNVAVFVCAGNELAGRYGIEVNVLCANGERMRFADPHAIELVPFTGIMDNFVVGSVELGASVFFDMRGEKGDKGDPGAAGRGISSITKTGTSGLVDTYTITYTDDTTSTYQVTNGEDAEGGVVMGKIDGVQFYKVVSFNAMGTPTFSDTAETGDPLKTYIDILTRQMYWYNPQPLPPTPGSSHYRNVADENVRVYEVSGATPTTNLLPNAFYQFTGAVTSLTLTLGTPIDGITNIYAFSFTAGADNPTISLPASVTIDGTPSIASGDYVEFSIMNNVAIFKVVSV